ncbi:MAG: hypothetical protein ACI4WH_00820 [Oscillospiraceae bacterium]
MNFDVLYSIAIDLINKKRNNNGNFSNNDFVCVLMTEHNSIFTGMSVSDIKDGKLVSSCAEYETIKIMMSSNETKIKALVNVNVANLTPSIPCDSCKKLILDINAQNSDCLIMKPDKTFCALKDINSNVSDDVWGMGWDDDELQSNGYGTNPTMNLDAFNPMSQSSQSQTNINATQSMDNPMPNNPVTPNKFGTASVYTSRYIDNPMPNNPVNPNMMGNSSVYNSKYVNPMPNSPINQPAINMGNSSTFQAISVDFNPLSYRPSNTQNPAVSSTLQTISLKQSNTVLGNNDSNNSKSSSIFRERLKNIMNDDIISESTSSSPNLDDIDEDKNNKKSISNTTKSKKDTQVKNLTKKELKALAKEKKKQAKKNSKILEAMEKQSK